MNIFVERDLDSPSLLRIDDVREIDVVEREQGHMGDDLVATTEKVYEVRANFDSVDGYDNSWRLVHYKSREAADTYHRFIGMTISRSAMRQESGVIVPRLDEEDALVLCKKFAGYDTEAKERAEREAAREEAQADAKPDEFTNAPHI